MSYCLLFLETFLSGKYFALQLTFFILFLYIYIYFFKSHCLSENGCTVIQQLKKFNLKSSAETLTVIQFSTSALPIFTTN